MGYICTEARYYGSCLLFDHEMRASLATWKDEVTEEWLEDVQMRS